MNPFRAYDIRGEVPYEVNSELAYRVGKAFCKFLKPKTVMVGYDTRDSSPRLFKSLVKGIRSQGVNVISLGLVTTPMFYYALNSHKVDGGIIVTSSHSPLNTNGLKICGKRAVSIHMENGLNKIKELSEKSIKEKKKGKLKKHRTFREYYQYIKPQAIKSKIKIGVDGANMSGVLDYKILKKLYKTKGIHVNIRATKPYFSPNPMITSNLKNIKEFVKKKKLDLGLFFDGDCDRVLFIDEKGKAIPADIMSALLIDKYKYKKVLKDQQSSQIIDEVCKKHKTKLLKTRIGHSLVDSKLNATKSDFASERSGHFYFKDFFYKDNGLLTAIKVINILDKPLSQTIKPYQKYFHSGEINFKSKHKQEIFKKIEKMYKNHKIDRFDGLKVTTKSHWIYIRKSKTQNLLRVNIEANTKTELKKVKSKITKLIKSY